MQPHLSNIRGSSPRVLQENGGGDAICACALGEGTICLSRRITRSFGKTEDCLLVISGDLT